MSHCYVLLLGGIGSGKSTVGRMLREMGAEVFDADAIGHDVLRQSDVRDLIAARWPEVVIDGAVNRSRLASIVFRDEAQLRRLESITHPKIAARISELTRLSESDVVVVESPTLHGIVEGVWLRVLVDAPDHVRLTRLVDRGLDAIDACRRMSHQPSRAEWIESADLVLDNGSDLGELELQVQMLRRSFRGCMGSTQ